VGPLLKYTPQPQSGQMPPRIHKNTLHLVKFMETISFGCETQSLIAVLTLNDGFHAVTTTTLTSFLPANDRIYSTLHQKLEWHSGHLSVVGESGVLGNQPGWQ
jgi:hypothetical protein